MRELLTEIPDAEVLLALEPEELAAKILFLLRRRQERLIHFGNLRMGLEMGARESAYPRNRLVDVDLAVAEAFAWLEAQGLVVPAEGTNGSNGFRHLSRRAQRFENPQAFVDYQTARLLPKALLHPAIANDVWLSFMRGAYPTAVFEAMRPVEIAVREAAGLPQSEIGVRMVRKAFHITTGPLTDMDADEGERDALCALFAGAIGSYKNPHSHRNVAIDTPREAIEMIMLASHLLGIVDARAAARQVAP
ncbi:TIGR02391 family protein [Paraburkholderia sp. HP33-1]|uniref:TIGR02391 family protein n=1 Tax=Paraburkholderia sp. HP33-1 TaxID=2883243 RepID=UPI001F1AE5A6|nr:TIGR02391 family protein [Paraburkholderia sp. HP33-1]